MKLSRLQRRHVAAGAAWLFLVSAGCGSAFPSEIREAADTRPELCPIAASAGCPAAAAETADSRPELSPFTATVGISPDGEYISKTGYIDTRGEIIVPPVYGYGEHFSAGTAVVSLSDPRVLPTQETLIGMRGELLLPWPPAGSFRMLHSLPNGLIRCQTAQGQVFLDRGGQPVFRDEWEEVSCFGDSLLMPFKTGGKWGVIGGTGMTVVPPEYPWPPKIFGDVIAAEEKHFLIPGDTSSVVPLVTLYDSRGEVISRHEYFFVSEGGDGLLRAGGGPGKNLRTSGYIGRDGRSVIPARFEYAGQFSEGLAAAALRNGAGHIPEERCGYIDRSGDFVIPQRFSEGGMFSGGLAPAAVWAKTGGSGEIKRWGYINRQGDFVIPPAFDSAEAFKDGFAVVSRGGRSGVISRTGEVIVPLEYLSAEHNGTYFRAVRTMRFRPEEYGLDDYYLCSGEKVDYCETFASGLTLTVRDGRGGYCREDGEMVLGAAFEYSPEGAGPKRITKRTIRDRDGNILYPEEAAAEQDRSPPVLVR